MFHLRFGDGSLGEGKKEGRMMERRLEGKEERRQKDQNKGGILETNERVIEDE